MPDERKRRKEIEEQISNAQERGLPFPYITDINFFRPKKTFVKKDDFSDVWREETPGPSQTSSFCCFIRGEDLVHKV